MVDNRFVHLFEKQINKKNFIDRVDKTDIVYSTPAF
jgi:hypothetical protein